MVLPVYNILCIIDQADIPELTVETQIEYFIVLGTIVIRV